MSVCALQLERTETREIAPALHAMGPMVLSGGAITTVVYKVFDAKADKVDKVIQKEPWRAFATVTMRLSLSKDPEFEVEIQGALGVVPVIPAHRHTAPGLTLIRHLSEYFPLLPKPYTGRVYAPVLEGA